MDKNKIFALSEEDISNYTLQLSLFYQKRFRHKHIIVCKIPYIYKILGVQAADFRLHVNKIEKARLGHEITSDFFDRLPYLLANPVFVMKSMTQIGRYVIVLNETSLSRESGELEPIIAILNIANKSAYFPSFYCKRKFNYFLEKNLKERNILYVDKEKALNIKPRCSNCTEDIFKAVNMVTTKEDIVNEYLRENI